MVKDRLIQGVAGLISALPTNKIRHLQSQIVGVFFLYSGFEEKGGVLTERLSDLRIR